MPGLSINDIVNVSVSLTPIAAAVRSFGVVLIVGQSAVIDVVERIRTYTSLAAVGADFGNSAPEYLAARNVFAQSPTPASLQIGRWAQTATAGKLKGGPLLAAEQLVSAWTGITTGSMKITIDATLKTLSALDFSAVTNMNAVAAVITTALGVSATCVWNAIAQRFEVTSATTGATSLVSYADVTGAGVDVSAKLHLTAATGAQVPVAGIVAESYLTAVTILANKSTGWYGLYGAAPAAVSADHIAVAGFIEAATPSRIYGVTSQDPNALVGTSTTDLSYLLKTANYGRTFAQYSSSDPYAAAAIFGIMFTVDFNGENTTKTLKFKTEAGETAETLDETAAAALKAKNCNVFVNYDNSTAIVQEGTMANGDFFDERHGLDWLQNRIQTDVFNRLYSAPKIPQTNGGMNDIATTVAGSCEAAVNNGLSAPGIWTGPPLGVLKTGQTLSKGYYVAMGDINLQSPADRQTRKATVCQVAMKLAGAVHYASVLVNVVR